MVFKVKKQATQISSARSNKTAGLTGGSHANKREKKRKQEE